MVISQRGTPNLCPQYSPYSQKYDFVTSQVCDITKANYAKILADSSLSPTIAAKNISVAFQWLYSSQLFFTKLSYCAKSNKVTEYIAINRLRAIWPKGYQRRSLSKSHQNGDYVKASNAKKLSSRRNQTCSLWITEGLIPAGRQLFRIACFYVVAVLVTLA